MSNPELPWKLLPKEDGTWLHFISDDAAAHTYDQSNEILLNLGPKDKVMEAMTQFLAEQDFGEMME